jgi:hypothetical protein
MEEINMNIPSDYTRLAPVNYERIACGVMNHVFELYGDRDNSNSECIYCGIYITVSIN